MATILRQAPTGDGYDVTILTAGRSATLHFLQQPTADVLAETIASYEKNLSSEIETTNKLDQEEQDD